MSNFYQAIRKFNRFELKYLISLKQAEELKQTLKRYMVPDLNGSGCGRYAIANLYYDSPDYRCYWEKENGIMFRRKLRIRHYETQEMMTEESPVFVEIKQRVDRVVQKRRAVLTYGEALRLCNDRQMPKCDPQDQEVVDEVFAFIWQYKLLPANIIRYKRQAFSGTIYDAGLRVTFDTDLTYQTHPLHLHEHATEVPFLSANKTILEIKINERIPFWLTDLIAEHNLNVFRISKYCCSIESAWKMAGFNTRNLFPESSQEVLASAYSLPLFWNRLCEAQEDKQISTH